MISIITAEFRSPPNLLPLLEASLISDARSIMRDSLCMIAQARASHALSSSLSQSPVNLTASLDSFGMVKPVAIDSKKDNAPGSHVWHADGNPNSSTGRPLA